MAAQAQVLHGEEKARRSIKPVAIDQRDRWQIQLGRRIGVFFRQQRQQWRH
jgi:hypothetical protein